MFIKHKCNLGLDLGTIPKIFHYVYSDIPKSKSLKPKTLPVPRTSDKGYSTCGNSVNFFSFLVVKRIDVIIHVSQKKGLGTVSQGVPKEYKRQVKRIPSPEIF